MKVKCSNCTETFEAKPYEIRNDELCPKCVTDLIPQENMGANQSDGQRSDYGGIGRAWYFLGMLVVTVLNYILQVATAAMGVPDMSILVLILVVALWITLAVYRLKNIGRNGAWAILIIIPIANLLVTIPCLMCPEGYQDTKKLDMVGKIIAGVIFGVLVLMIIGIIIAVSS